MIKVNGYKINPTIFPDGTTQVWELPDWVLKDPKTDSGIKKSLVGRVAVVKDGDSYSTLDHLGINDVITGDLLVPIFKDGVLLVDEKFSTIRERLVAYANL